MRLEKKVGKFQQITVNLQTLSVVGQTGLEIGV
jgi:hypothetical protein